ncbi:chorismate mutase [Lentilactobacillus sp. Marseille-Q4993]|uniref:chorismate mutase n=1 Tax=Lentilactobacillus sp. Marseille-Q4993 TaxID=3039492 RepID=UPI0024BC1D7F|nr:chorismate mutase [Lentilactobacillus sp. Marseille-Q4993]
MTELDDFRNQIDELDNMLTLLLEKRFEVVNQVGDYKQKNGIAIFNSNREDAVIDKVLSRIKDPAKQAYIANVFREIMDESKEYQNEITGGKQ